MTTDTDIITTARHVAAVTGLAGKCAPKLLAVLNDASLGYPTKASGSDAGGGGGTATVEREQDNLDWLQPDELGHRPTSKTTPTERAALQHDEARRIKARFGTLMSNIDKNMLEVSNILGYWLSGHTIDPSEAKDVDEERDKMWCTNHLSLKLFEVRDGRHRLCQWCRKFQASEKFLPDRELCDIKDRKGCITEPDAQRAKVRHDERVKAEKAAAKKQRKRRPVDGHLKKAA